MNEKRLEKDVNEFIENSQIKVLGLQFMATVFYFSVMISYEDTYNAKLKTNGYLILYLSSKRTTCILSIS